MKMNTGAWIGIIGGAAGLLAGIIAVLATVPGPEGIYTALGMLLLFGGMFFLMYKLIFAPMLNHSRLQKTGLPGRARILGVKDTGVTINNNPQVKLEVEVLSNLGQRYTTSIRVLVSRINPFQYQPGMEIPVKIDPKNEKNVVIDTSGAAAAGPTANVNETALKAELENMQQTNDAIRLSGRPARAIIKTYTWLGAYVNGNNPYAELEVEVLPENSSSFSAKIRGVIAEASLPKYQPGKEIYVKYDLYDNSRVTIDHS